MKLLIQCDNKEIKDKYVNHTHYNIGDSGIDLFTNKKITVKSGETSFIDFGIKCEAFDDYGKPSSFWLIPRSSIAKTNLRQANSIGLIDAKYRGNILAAVDNIKNNDYTVDENTRLFQIVAPDTKPIFIEIVEKLSDTERGSGGFGSTGQ